MNEKTAAATGAMKYLGERVREANRLALERILSVEPAFVGVDTAINAIEGMTPATILHSGPPVKWERMCDAQQRAVRGAVIFEGIAESDAEAQNVILSGGIALSPNHHHNSVAPMTGVISASMPVIVSRDATYGATACSTFNEGGGRALWFGSVGVETITRLRWMRDTFAPAMKKALSKTGAIPIWSVLAQGIQMGDECHNRHAASTNIFLRMVSEAIFSIDLPQDVASSVYRFIAGNSHFFLNFTMTACKLAMDAARGIEHSTVVTAMTRNGTDFGIRVSGLGDRWFVAPAPYLLDALYNPGYGPEAGAPDIGDSSIIETMGLGGFAIAAAPAMASFAGGGFEDAANITRQMGFITLARNSKFAIPVLNFEGTPTGIDIRRVVETGVLPSINSAVVHRSSGAGQIGAGIVQAPYECFALGLAAFADRYKLSGS
ncbi:MAG: DUF1116 domain-containing protein [Deltaproteobacteria bacterium]